MNYKFKTKPYAHQITALEKSWNRETYAYFMEMGTGKTKVLIDNAAMLYDKGKIDGLLIIAPKGVVGTWYTQELPTHLPDHIENMTVFWQENITTNVVDVDPITMCIDPEDVRKHITPNTKAVIAVNQAGVPAPIDEIREFFDGLIIEDCAHSCYTPGAGTKGDIAIWSFQAVKTMPCGDGGMITLNDEKLYHKLKEMTWFGVSSTFSRVAKEDTVTGKPGYTWDYEVDKIGYKCYMIDLAAALCLEQMKKLPKNLELRRYIQSRYNKGLCEQVERPPFTDTVQYYCAKVPAEHRANLIDYLASKNVHTSVHFKPLHKYEIIQKHATHPGREFPIADKEWLRLVSLPVHPGMTEEDIDYVIYWVNKFFEEEV